jgi:Ca-activated chloride channel family protein
MIRFLQPWWLLGLVPVLALAAGYVWRQWRRRAYAVKFSNLELLRSLAPAGLGWRRHLGCMPSLPTRPFSRRLASN